MNRHPRLSALVVVFAASCLRLAGQTEPEAMPVRPVGSQPEPVITVQPPARATPPPPAPRVVPDESKERIAKLEADLAKAQGELTKVRNELAAARTEASRARTAVKDSHDRYANVQESLETQVTELTAARDRTQSSLDLARAELASTRERLAVYEKTLRENTPPDAEELRAALKESQMRVDMTVRAFANIETENNRIRAQFKDVDPKEAAAELEDARLALADAQRDLFAERSRSNNLARELSRAKPGAYVVVDESLERSAPTAPTAPTPPSEAADTVSAAPAGEAKTHTVADGENLSVISKRYYGTSARWVEIYNANRDVMRNENHLVPGMTLRIP